MAALALDIHPVDDGNFMRGNYACKDSRTRRVLSAVPDMQAVLPAQGVSKSHGAYGRKSAFVGQSVLSSDQFVRSGNGAVQHRKGYSLRSTIRPEPCSAHQSSLLHQNSSIGRNSSVCQSSNRSVSQIDSVSQGNLLSHRAPLFQNRTKERRHVRPDIPRTYGASLRSVPEHSFVYIPARLSAGEETTHTHSVDRPHSASLKTSSKKKGRSAALVKGDDAGVSKAITLSDSLVTAPMKAVFTGGLLIGMMGIIFSFGLNTALQVGLIG